VEAPGIVNCVAYSGGSRVREVPLEETSEVLKQSEGFVWIGLYEPDEELLRQVQAEFSLHDLAIEDAHRAHQRPKIEEYGESLFVVLRTVQDGAQRREVQFGETHVFVGPRYVVTVRHGASLSYGEVRARCESSRDHLRQGPGFVLYAIMDFVVDRYFPIVDELEEELTELEDRIFAGTQHGKEIAHRIYRLKSQLLFLKRAVSPLIEVCNRLVRFDRTLILPETRLYFRDIYDHVIRINESVDNMRELLTSALETNLALVSVRQNEVMKRLAAGGAMIAVPTLIAGVYGMNFEVMPEIKWVFGYPFALGLMVASCALIYLAFRRSRWV